MALDQQKTFHRYHRVLSHAVWSSQKANRVLLHSLLRQNERPQMDVPDAPGRGSVELLGMDLGVPFGVGSLRALLPRAAKRHKKITERAWQMLVQLRRWQPRREIVAVVHGGHASGWQGGSERRALAALFFNTPVLLRTAIWAQPQRDVRRLHRLPNHSHQILSQRVQVCFVA